MNDFAMSPVLQKYVFLPCIFTLQDEKKSQCMVHDIFLYLKKTYKKMKSTCNKSMGHLNFIKQKNHSIGVSLSARLEMI